MSSDLPVFVYQTEGPKKPHKDPWAWEVRDPKGRVWGRAGDAKGVQRLLSSVGSEALLYRRETPREGYRPVASFADWIQRPS